MAFSSINLADLLSKTEIPKETEVSDRKITSFKKLPASSLCYTKRVKAKKFNLTLESLDESQKAFVKYTLKNPNSLILIQSSPGTGKTRTLQVFSVLYKKNLNVIIFKKDLLASFEGLSNIYSNTQFFMRHFQFGGYFNHLNIEKEFGYTMTFFELFFIIIALIKKFKCDYIQDEMFIFDEYTFIPKPILFSLLLIFKHLNIPAIFCGDKHQLQNIQDVKLMKTSSHDISKSFVDKTFKFDVNHRCTDSYYNDIINYLASLSNDDVLDEIGMALVALIYPEACFADLTENLLEYTFIAPEYKDISKAVYELVERYNVPCSFYHIYSKSDNPKINGVKMVNGLYKCNATIDFEKFGYKNDSFLPFMPLTKNTPYFVEETKNDSIATLEDIEFVEINGIKVPNKLIFKKNNRIKKISKGPTKTVFSKHKDFLLGTNGAGALYQFDAARANEMSYQMCQGRTIPKEIVVIISERSTFRGLYVLATRTTDPKNIKKVYLPNYFRYLLSNIINFPELCNGNKVPVDIMKIRFENYVLYSINTIDRRIMDILSTLVLKYYKSQNEDERNSIRRDIMKIPLKTKILNFKKNDSMMDKNYMVLYEHKDLLLKLSKLDDIEAAVWVYEFFNCPENSVFQCVFNGLSKLSSSQNALSLYASLNNLETLIQSTKKFIESNCIIDYLKIVKQDDGTEKILTNNIVRECKNYTCIKTNEHNQTGLYTTNLLSKIYNKLVQNERFCKSEMIDWLDVAIEENVKSQIEKSYSRNGINKRHNPPTISQPIDQIPINHSKRFRRK